MSLPFLVHCHIPKTGGSALNQRFMLPHFGARDVYMLYRHVFEMAERLPTLHTSRAMRSFAASGHVPFGFFQQVYPEAVHISVFRDPVERMVSFLNYVVTQPRHGVQQRLPAELRANPAEDPDRFVIAVLDDPRLAVVQSNVQTRLAAGCARLGDRPVSPEHLRMASRNIARHDYLVGDQARLGSFLADLRERFPRPEAEGPVPRPDAQTEKRMPRKLTLDMLAPGTRERLAAANTLDLRLYEAITRQHANLAAAA